MPFVVDASVTVCWAFKDEDHSIANATLERLRTDEATAPTLWWFEMRNIVVVSERRRRLTEAESMTFCTTSPACRCSLTARPRKTRCCA